MSGTGSISRSAHEDNSRFRIEEGMSSSRLVKFRWTCEARGRREGVEDLFGLEGLMKILSGTWNVELESTLIASTSDSFSFPLTVPLLTGLALSPFTPR